LTLFSILILLDRKSQTTKDLEKPWKALNEIEDRLRLASSTTPASTAVPPQEHSHPHGTHSALTSILLDDSALKAALQPYNHLCIPEYTQVMREADLKVLRWDGEIGGWWRAWRNASGTSSGDRGEQRWREADENADTDVDVDLRLAVKGEEGEEGWWDTLRAAALRKKNDDNVRGSMSQNGTVLAATTSSSSSDVGTGTNKNHPADEKNSELEREVAAIRAREDLSDKAKRVLEKKVRKKAKKALKALKKGVVDGANKADENAGEAEAEAEERESEAEGGTHSKAQNPDEIEIDVDIETATDDPIGTPSTVKTHKLNSKLSRKAKRALKRAEEAKQLSALEQLIMGGGGEDGEDGDGMDVEVEEWELDEVEKRWRALGVDRE
jgi:hypothetical protein